MANNAAYEYGERVEIDMLTTIINKQTSGLSMNFSTLGKYLLQTLSLFSLLSTFVIAETAPTTGSPSNVIQNVEFSTLPGNRLQISLELSYAFKFHYR